MLRWKLHELLARKRVTGAELARRMNVHINTVDKLRQDRPTMLRFEYIEAICEMLPCDPAELFEVTTGMTAQEYHCKICPEPRPILIRWFQGDNTYFDCPACGTHYLLIGTTPVLQAKHSRQS